MKAPVVLLVVGGLIGGLIALSTSGGPPSLSGNIATPPAVLRVGGLQPPKDDALAPFVDEPNLTGASASANAATTKTASADSSTTVKPAAGATTATTAKKSTATTAKKAVATTAKPVTQVKA